MSDDAVAVVGLGIHPFGRHPGVSGLEMAAHAARAALADAGIGWDAIDFAAGGSDAAGNADTTVSVLGLTGVPFINVKNGCATGGSALITAHAMLAAGSAEIALVVGFDKHPPGAFNPLPEEWGIGSWYGETGLMLTTQFFAMKIQRYMAQHGDQRVDAGQGREPRRSRTAAATRTPGAASRSPRRTCWPRRWSTTRCASTCSARPARARSRSCWRAASGSGELSAKPVYLRSAVFRTRRFGSFEVFSPSIPVETGPSPTTEAAAAAFEQAGIGPERRRRRAAPGHRVRRRDHAPGRDRPVRARRAGVADPERRDADRRAPAGQHRRRLPGQRRADRRLRAAPGARGRAAAARRRRRAPDPRARRGSASPRSTAPPE